MADPSRLTDLRGDVAVVTGGAHGIGAACAELLAAAGARVAVLDREQPVALPEGGAVAIALDVTDDAAVDAAMAAVAERWGRLDVLVASAGIALRRPSTELALADWQKVVDVNLTGVFLCARSAARHMIAAGGGRIATVASIMGVVGGGVYPNVSYQAAKGGVINLTRALALEWAEHAIRVNAVAPTYVRTRLTGGARGRSRGAGADRGAHPARAPRGARRGGGRGALPGGPRLGDGDRARARGRRGLPRAVASRLERAI